MQAFHNYAGHGCIDNSYDNSFNHPFDAEPGIFRYD